MYAGFSIPVPPSVSAVHHADGSNAGYILQNPNGERIHYDEFGNYAGFSGVVFPETSSLFEQGNGQKDQNDLFDHW